MNDFFTSGEKLTAFKLNEMFNRIARRVESLEKAQAQSDNGQLYNSGAVTSMPGRPSGLANPVGAYPPRRHAIDPQSFYTAGRTTLWTFPTVGHPDNGAGHEVTSGTTGYDTSATFSGGEEIAESVTTDWDLSEFYPVAWTPHGEEDETSATAFFGVAWAGGAGEHFIHLQKSEKFAFSNTYDPETGSITWAQPLGQPAALPWGSSAGGHGAWHYFRTNFNVIQPTAISSYQKPDSEFASVHYHPDYDGGSSTTAPTEEASYALYSKIFLNGAKFKRLRGHLGTEVIEHDGIISVKSRPWQIWYQAISDDDDDTDTDSVTDSGHGFGWYGFAHRASHATHSVKHLQVYPGSGTVRWHVYSHDDQTSATSSFGLNVYVQHVSAGVAQVAYEADGGITLPAAVTTATSWTAALAVSVTDVGDYGIGHDASWFVHTGTSPLGWHVIDSDLNAIGKFGFHVAVETADDLDPTGARVRLTPWGQIQIPYAPHGITSITTYIQTLSQTTLYSAPDAFDGHIIVPANDSYSLSGTVGQWHISGIGSFGIMLYASAQAGDSGVSLQYQPYTLYS